MFSISGPSAARLPVAPPFPSSTACNVEVAGWRSAWSSDPPSPHIASQIASGSAAAPLTPLVLKPNAESAGFLHISSVRVFKSPWCPVYIYAYMVTKAASDSQPVSLFPLSLFLPAAAQARHNLPFSHSPPLHSRPRRRLFDLLRLAPFSRHPLVGLNPYHVSHLSPAHLISIVSPPLLPCGI